MAVPVNDAVGNGFDPRRFDDHPLIEPLLEFESLDE
jgi:hypothetical protein